jgi:lipoprotein-anchoring transpeptidase ErfK/SrfK
MAFRPASWSRTAYPNYFLNGIAIHGSPAMKAYPDSHGCIRIPMFAAKEVSEMTPVGTIVVIYDDSGAEAQSRGTSLQ